MSTYALLGVNTIQPVPDREEAGWIKGKVKDEVVNLSKWRTVVRFNKAARRRLKNGIQGQRCRWRLPFHLPVIGLVGGLGPNQGR